MWVAFQEHLDAALLPSTPSCSQAKCKFTPAEDRCVAWVKGPGIKARSKGYPKPEFSPGVSQRDPDPPGALNWRPGGAE